MSDFPEVRFTNLSSFDIHAQSIAVLDQIMNSRRFEYRQPDFMSIAIKRARKLIRNDHTDTRGLDGFGGNGSSRRASEIAAGNKDVSLLNLLGNSGLSDSRTCFAISSNPFQTTCVGVISSVGMLWPNFQQRPSKTSDSFIARRIVYRIGVRPRPPFPEMGNEVLTPVSVQVEWRA